jgi:hypothetical protein
MIKFAKPQIPSGLLHDMKSITVLVTLEKDNGGQWKPSPPVETAFKGVVMPLNNEDLQFLPEGAYTINAQKLYTNGATLEVGAQFTDTYDGATYTVVQALTHGPIHPMKRYVVEKAGRAAAHAVS